MKPTLKREGKPTLKPEAERGQLRIKPKFRRALIKLDPETYNGLKDQIKKDGQLSPIIGWRDPQRSQII